MKVLKHMMKLSLLLLLLFIFLVGCSDDVEDADPDKTTYYDLIYTLHFGDYESVYNQSFSEELKEELSLRELEENWEQITDTSGDFVRVRYLRSNVNEEELEVVQSRIEYEHVIFDIRMMLDETHQIVGFNLLNPVVNATLPEFVVEESIVVGEGSDYELNGTLTLPRFMQGNLPAVVLVHGSGPSDRDGTALSYKPFRDIAWGLAEQGIAVIRYDKRTLTYGEEILEEGDTITAHEETVIDAIRAAAVLKDDDRINSDNVFILGHSLGGALAPRIDEQGGDFAGIISLAGSPRPLWDMVYDQNEYFKDIYITDENEKDAHMESIEEEYEKAQQLTSMTQEEAREINIFGMNGHYLKEMAQYDIGSMVSNLDKPVLILQGKDDFQVFYEKDFAMWENLLDGRDNATLISYENLNHFFIEYDGPDKGTIEEYHHPRKVSVDVINDIGEWIIQNQN